MERQRVTGDACVVEKGGAESRRNKTDRLTSDDGNLQRKQWYPRDECVGPHLVPESATHRERARKPDTPDGHPWQLGIPIQTNLPSWLEDSGRQCKEVKKVKQ
ncbi:hypothetical protein PG994_009554 [Apiospora phragmitis]|uniref:Uncharacterized protein n=1 Tax=Apiospora phragmitis TaxID=2905665 RepID=A0ABR1U6Z9_9PEZI